MGEVMDMFTRLRPYRAKKRMGRCTQGVARGLALPWANEWLRLWREEESGSKQVSRGRIRWVFGPGCRWDGEALRQRAESRGQRSGEGCGFVSEDIGDEMLTPRDCPEYQRSGRQGSGMKDPRASGALVLGWRQNRECGARASRAHTGLRNVCGGLPRAPLADSLCPGLTSGCAFGAKKGAVPTRGSKGRNRWDSPGMPQPRDGGLPSRGLSRNRPVEPAEGFPFDCGERVG